ncbi:metallophosphoesterase family protein [Candidatus Woesearchaeota archaeon]|nr:metallophosphoesterase family protein [Candidatus Woesearchaeota archaeon]
MQILAFTDNHGDKNAYAKIKEKAVKADIILCGGDFTIFEHEWQDHARLINSLGKLVLLIHGNHESETLCQKMANDFQNIHFLHNRVFKIKNLMFFGWGGGGFSDYYPDFEKAVREKQKHFDKEFVLLTHAPPYNTNIDLVGRQHVGSKSFSKFIAKHQPRLALSGHLHENFKKVDKIGNTIIMNPGPQGTVIKITPL